MTRLILFAFTISALLLSNCSKSTQEKQLTLEVTFELVGPNQSPLPGLTLNLLSAIDSVVLYTGISNQQGLVVFQLPPDSTYRATVSGLSVSDCQTIVSSWLRDQPNQEQIYGPFSTNTTIPKTIEWIAGVGGTGEVSGRLVDCNNIPTSGWVVYYQNGLLRVLSTQADGRFSFQTTYCQNGPQTSFQFFQPSKSKSHSQNITFDKPVVTLGDIVVCEESLPFCEIETSVGKQFLIAGWVKDSTINWYYLGHGAFTSTTVDNVEFAFENTETGSFNAEWAVITDNSYPCYACGTGVQLPTCSSFNVQITRWDGVGGFAEGVFDGFLPPTQLNTLPYDGNFKGTFKLPIR
jgi:hypothetical protein